MTTIPTLFAVPPPGPTPRYSPTQLNNFREWWYTEIEDAFSARFAIESEWRDCLRMYEGKPELEVRDTPIPNAPNIEITLGAIAADAIYAQGIDTIFQTSPVLTVRAVNEQYVLHAKALQRFVNYGVANEWNFRPAVMHTLCDDTQLGTGVYYIPWVEFIRKTFTERQVAFSGPRIRSIAPEDFLTPGAAPASLHEARWVAMRSFLTGPELVARSKLQKWDIEGAMTTATSGMLRQRREQGAKTRRTGEETFELVECLEGYAHYDIDGDGICEDLLVTFDRTSRTIFRLTPNPYDRCRPFESMVYQPRPHYFNGYGVIKMLAEFERSATEIHNCRLLNMFLANCRVWAIREGSAQESEEIWPGKRIPLTDPKNDIVPLQMADIYTSIFASETVIQQYAEKRSGVSDLTGGRSAGIGSRTPGITALSAIQSVNVRFSPAFEEMRTGSALAVRQCVYRYQERVMSQDAIAMDRIRRVLGEQDARLVVQLLQDPDFDEGMFVELTASSASTNRESDRQNAIMLVNMLGQYYKGLIELMTLITNPLVPPPLQQVGMKIVDASAEAMDRTIRTFDQVRDPGAFVIRFQDVVQAMQPPAPAQDIGALMGVLQQIGPQGAGPEGAPQAPGPQAPAPAPVQQAA